MKRWHHKVALVTGASGGIGRAVAHRLATEGMHVVALARRGEALEALAESLAEVEGSCTPIRADMRREGDLLAAFQTIRERFGGIDVLVNNAGLGHSAPLLSGQTEHWREMLEVNVLGLCIATREGVSDMRRRGDDGHVIHISSMSAHRVPPAAGVYSASKFAVRSLTEGLRSELRRAGSGVRVSAISPGFVETDFAAHYHKSEAVAARTYGRYKVLESKDIADTVCFLLTSPAHMQVHDILIRPTLQDS